MLTAPFAKSVRPTFLHSCFIWQALLLSLKPRFSDPSLYSSWTKDAWHMCACIHLARTICPSLSSIFMHWHIHHICLVWSESNLLISKPHTCTLDVYRMDIWYGLTLKNIPFPGMAPSSLLSYDPVFTLGKWPSWGLRRSTGKELQLQLIINVIYNPIKAADQSDQKLIYAFCIGMLE